ncbi:Signal recognition particle receptor subunit beta [Ascoidea rubescens DSM 1968]|uniref:Signal recognition particle receptor subunit beta n=1 Tax=Ascoidea rubescens DSM 1968 TaxID=1344418 RepID=A0A1D2VGX9_9ASCO|nr:P-loop containing nucleoside triphosphate hydrolase protein [Ascoidea rubescens DSM 1968]ODV60852.1 P-loop containing nucleoside triphosphate hydrolase protein [Ascoidea rubescens DSM 1968]
MPQETEILTEPAATGTPNSIILITILVGLVLLGLFLIFQKSYSSTPAHLLTNTSIKKNHIPTFLIIGPSNSGKTTLFHYLSKKSSVLEANANGKDSDSDNEANNDKKVNNYLPADGTVTSTTFNINNQFKLPLSSSFKKNHILIDIPGNIQISNNLVPTFLKNYLNIKGIIYLIDSNASDESLISQSNFLFNLLLKTESYSPNGIDILIGLNKSEIFGSKPIFKVKNLLINQFDLLKRNYFQNRSSTIKNIDTDQMNQPNSNSIDNDNSGDNDNDFQFANSSTSFSFDQLEGNVDFFTGSLYKNDIDRWENWLDERAVN